MNVSVIIPSRNSENLMPCVEAVQRHEPKARIVVIDDGLDFQPTGLRYIMGAKPFVFARNCNVGIKQSEGDDIVLLNDDAILESPGGFTKMQAAAADNPELGLVSAATNVAGNPAQHRQFQDGIRVLAKNTPGNSFPTVAFVCVLIPRRTIAAIGLMDERFGGFTREGKRIYGYCDNDYCRRVRDAGMKVAVHDGCYVDHSKLKSTFRGGEIDMSAAQRLYLQKWGSM